MLNLKIFEKSTSKNKGEISTTENGASNGNVPKEEGNGMDEALKECNGVETERMEDAILHHGRWRYPTNQEPHTVDYNHSLMEDFRPRRHIPGKKNRSTEEKKDKSRE